MGKFFFVFILRTVGKSLLTMIENTEVIQERFKYLTITVQARKHHRQNQKTE